MKMFLTILLILSCTFLNAKSWYFDSIHIQATVNADGSMDVHEERSYHFKGNFRWADYNLSPQPNQHISNFTISEAAVPFALNDSEDAGSYEIERVNDQFYAKWYYRAKYENRTFNLDYNISNAVKVYDDIAELYWKFIGNDNPEYVEIVTIEITLPQKAVFNPVRAWAHGPLWGNIELKNDNVFLSVNKLPEEQFVEARILFPKTWVSESRNFEKGLFESKILIEEEAFSYEANEKRKQAIIDLEQKIIDNQKAYDISLPLVFLLILIFLIIYRKYGVGFKANYTQKIDANVPKDMHPVLLNCVYFSNSVTGSTLSTTLFYLAQNGILQLEADNENPKKWYDSSEPIIMTVDRNKWQEKKEGLKDFENDLLDMLFNTISKGEDRVTSRQLKKASSKMQKWFVKWTKMVKLHLEKNAYYERESKKGAIINAIISFFFLIGAIFITVYLGENGALILVPSVIFFLLSFSILRFTPETKLLKKKLEAFRNYLKRFNSTSFDRSNINYITDYFLFAVAFALGKKVVGNIVNVIPSDQHAAIFPWYIGSMGSTNFAATINSIVTAAGTSVSSASGAGGGMSGGGGGGGGGASGGAG